MKLENILDRLGSIEKNAFIKIIDNIISDNPRNKKEIEKILSSSDKGLNGYFGSFCATHFGDIVPGISVQIVPLLSGVG